MIALYLLCLAALASADVATPSWIANCSNRIQIVDDFRNASALNVSLWLVEDISSSHMQFSPAGLELHVSAVAGSLTLATNPTFSSAIFTVRMKSYAAPGFVSTAVVRPPAATMIGTDEIDIEITGNEVTTMQMVAW
jgi:hypothetical protein